MSLANLLCLGVWRILLVPGPEDLYFLSRPAHWSFVLGGLLVFVVFAWALYGLAGCVRRSRSCRVLRAARWGLVLVMAFALNALRHGVPALSAEHLLATLGPIGASCLVGVGFVGFAFAAAHCGLGALSRGVMRVLLAFSPFVLVTASGAIVGAVRDQAGLPGTLRDRSPLPLVAGTPTRRVVLVLFDELDQNAAFAQREAGLALPELDLLQASGISAARAYPPSHATWMSVPAVLTGLPVRDVRWIGPSELLLMIPGEARGRRWSEEPTIFTRVHALGLNAGLAGWAHPYCRVVGHTVASCSWIPYVPPPGSTWRETVFTHLSLIAETVPGVARLDLRKRLRVGRAYQISASHHRDAYLRLHHDTLNLVADPRFAFVFAHYPVPHGPFIWDRRGYAFRVDGAGTYSDNLALADLALGEIRAALDRSSLAAKTAVIVTSDHWRRATGGERGPDVTDPLQRIPLLVRLPGQTEGVAVEGVLRTTLVHDLVLRLLEGELRDPRSVVDWITQRVAGVP